MERVRKYQYRYKGKTYELTASGLDKAMAIEFTLCLLKRGEGC